MSKSKSHSRAQGRAVGRGTKTGAKIPESRMHLDAVTKSRKRATEVERSGDRGRIAKTDKRPKASTAPKQAIQALSEAQQRTIQPLMSRLEAMESFYRQAEAWAAPLRQRMMAQGDVFSAQQRTMQALRSRLEPMESFYRQAEAWAAPLRQRMMAQRDVFSAQQRTMQALRSRLEPMESFYRQAEAWAAPLRQRMMAQRDVFSAQQRTMQALQSTLEPMQSFSRLAEAWTAPQRQWMALQKDIFSAQQRTMQALQSTFSPLESLPRWAEALVAPHRQWMALQKDIFSTQQRTLQSLEGIVNSQRWTILATLNSAPVIQYRMQAAWLWARQDTVTKIFGDPVSSTILLRRQRRGSIQPEQYDFFISHASEDKHFVGPMVQHLRFRGADVWYDELILGVGDSLPKEISYGLTHSRFGVVVLSKSFFKKRWAMFELEVMLSLQVEGRIRILPIWYDISKDEVIKLFPMLIHLFALERSKYNYEEIVEQLMEQLILAKLIN